MRTLGSRAAVTIGLALIAWLASRALSAPASMRGADVPAPISSAAHAGSSSRTPIAADPPTSVASDDAPSTLACAELAGSRTPLASPAVDDLLDTTPVEVVVRTSAVATPGGPFPPLPARARIQVGVARREHGLHPAERGVPSTELSVDLPGRQTLTLDVPRAWLASPERISLWGRSLEPWTTGRHAFADLRGGATPAPLELRVEQGARVSGRVLDARGAPVAGAWMELLSGARPGLVAAAAERLGLAHGLQVVASGRSDERGAFELGASRWPGSGGLHVLARAGGFGSALASGLALAAEPEPLVLVLRGEGTLQGVLLDPGGTPVPDRRLVALPAGQEGLPAHERRAREWSGGLAASEVRTDEEGRFAFAGLVPGRYDLRGPSSEGTALLAPSVETGACDLRLVTSATRLVVDVLDERGAPVVLDRWGVLERWRRRGPLVVCRPDGERDGRPLPALVAERVEENRAVFTLARGTGYTLSLLSPDHPLLEEPVALEEGAWTVRRTLRLSAATAPAELALRVTLEDGSKSRLRPRVEVRTAGGQLLDEEFVALGAELLVALPPGRYAVRVEPSFGPPDDCLLASADEPSAGSAQVALLRAQPACATVELAAGERRELSIALPPAGVVHATLAGLPERALLDPAAETMARAGWGEVWQEDAGTVFGLVVRLRTASGVELAPEDVLLFSWTLACRRGDAPSLWLDALAPGDYELVVRVAERGERRAAVQVRAGETSELTLRF